MDDRTRILLRRAAAGGTILLLGWLAWRWLRPADYDRPLPPGKPTFIGVSERRVPSLADACADRKGLRDALGHSLTFLAKPSARDGYPVGDASHHRTVKSIEAFRRILDASSDPADVEKRLRKDFVFYRGAGWNGRGNMLFTGYYTPVLDGRRSAGGGFDHPLYRPPPELVMEDGIPRGRRLPDGRIVPWPDRREIEEKKLLSGRGLELVWLRDPFDAFLAHLQGSVRVRLPGEGEILLGYAGKTDRPYGSVAGALLSDGKIPKSRRNLAGIRRHFRERPEDLDYLNRNPSYVFFTERPDAGRTPRGSLNEPLVPFRSLALDKDIFPRGALALVDTKIPGPDGKPRTFRQFMLVQDTGGAIRAPGRADIYTGIGNEAEKTAGGLYAEGRIYFILLRDK
ncbi:MAG: MltA domain-containing protein [Planctomycetota bacterium]